MTNPRREDTTRATDHRFTRRTAIRAGGVGLAAAFSRAGLSRAQQATPGATPTPSGPVTVAAKWLNNPRGFAWDEHGNLFVAIAGAGGATVVGADMSGGPAMTGDTSIVARIEQGIPQPVATGLPSTRTPAEETMGLAAVAILDGQVYVLEDANAMAFRDIGRTPDGVYRVEPDGTFTLIADTAAWIGANPVSHKPADFNPRGEVFGMVADKESLWVIESNSGQVLNVTPDGTIKRIVDLSEGHPLPTGPALSPNGGIYVGFLTMSPYFDGSSKVIEVTPDGKVTDVWTGLTMVTAVAVDKQGTLYAAEMATGNTTTPPYIAPATGKVVRQTGLSTAEDVATNVNYPISLAVGPDGAVYVGAPAKGSNDGDGYLLRIDTTAKSPTDVRPVAATVGGQGLGIPPAGANNSYYGGATPPDDPASPTTPTPTPTETNATPVQTVQIDAGEFYFTPKDFTIPAGVPIEFAVTDKGQLPHNFSIDELHVSIYMQPGATSKATVIAAKGSYEFYCNLPGHKAAGMFGTITVQ